MILFYRDLAELPDIPRYDIMLSPQFYVIKHEDIPVKYSMQAKKLAPSILDELSGDETMTHEVFQDGDKWVFIAYDLKKLTEALEAKGGSIDRVGRIYFAEQAKEKFDIPVKLNDREVLAVVNDTVTVVPTHLLENSDNLAEFDASFRPDKSFRVQRGYSSYISPKQAMIAAAILGVLGVAYFAEGYRYQNAVTQAEGKLDQLLADNPSLSGAYARESIYKKFMDIDTQQRNIRDRIKSISRMISSKTKINSLYMDKKGYKVIMDAPTDPKSIKSLRTIAKSGGLENLDIKAGKLESHGSLQ